MKTHTQGDFPGGSVVKNLTLPTQGSWVWSLLGELRTQMLHSTDEINKCLKEWKHTQYRHTNATHRNKYNLKSEIKKLKFNHEIFKAFCEET